MINGAHVGLYSTDADADRAFLRDVMGMPHVDVGEGWLIFGLPAAEVAVHPAEESGKHELFFLCEDVEAFVGSMTEKSIECTEIEDRGWGLLTQMTMPGGHAIGVYQPRHERPPSMG
ncbi:MAG: extradiol dioxygenase [Planctomycetes bacterium]|nr:extradiol dioxygenase [Planctomycetota bacterium]